MIYRLLLQTALAATIALSVPAVMPGADYEEAVHPICRQGPRDPCVKLMMNFSGKSDTTLFVDRIEAKVQSTCNVHMQSGALKVASTDSLTFPKVAAKADPVSRAFWFPNGCNVWIHVREPYVGSKDKIVEQTFHLTEDLTINVGLSGDETKDHPVP